MRKIQNIIFDLGGVLLNLDWEASAKAFRRLGLQIDDRSYIDFLHNPVLLKFETGKIAPPVFYNEIRRILNNAAVTDRQIYKAWCAMIGDVPQPKIDLLERLRLKFKLFLFSNTNELHIEYFKQKFGDQYGFDFEAQFEKVFYSHRIHDRKPLTTSFEKIISRARIDKAETLFIDDSEENTEAAIKTGIPSLLYTRNTSLGHLIDDFVK